MAHKEEGSLSGLKGLRNADAELAAVKDPK